VSERIPPCSLLFLLCPGLPRACGFRDILGKEARETMEDSLEDEILYQTYISHMNKFTFILPFVPQRLPTLNYALRILRLYLLKPEVFIVTFVSIVLLVYLQTANNLWGRPVIARLQNGLSKSTYSCTRQLLGKTIKSSSSDSSWCTVGEKAAVFAIQGRRPHMEDRFVLAENFGESGVSLFAVFDGHGGEVFLAHLILFNILCLLSLAGL
jgi:protein phosphatase 1L